MTGAVEDTQDPALLQQGRVLICLGMSKPLFRVFVSLPGRSRAIFFYSAMAKVSTTEVLSKENSSETSNSTGEVVLGSS